jgi:RHS repeat-associated protein
LPDLGAASGDFARVSARRVWENYDCAREVASALCVDAFGVEIGRSGTTDVEHLYRGERWDANVSAYDLRARLYTPGNGRFLTQDSFVGFSMDPQSLHKYAFNHNDPVNRVDPSGHMSLSELSATQNIQGILQVVSRVDSVLKFYGRVNSAIDLVMGLRQMLMMFEGDLTASIPRSFPPRVDFADAAQKFVSGGTKAFGIGSPSWIAGYAAEFAKGKRLTAYVLYLPVLVPQLPSLVNAGGKKINGKPVKIGLGAPGGKIGSLGGVGVVMGHERQLFRMDIGATPAGHVAGRGNEIKPFDEPPFSFHVYNWGGGPR